MTGASQTRLQQLCREALARDPAREAIFFEGRWHVWGSVAQIASRLSAALDASGIASDAPVAFIPRNRPSALAALLGLIAQGRSIRMIYAFLSSRGIATDIARLKPAALVGDIEDFAPLVCEQLSHGGLAGVALSGDEVSVVPGCAHASPREVRTDDDGPNIEILTSGTTGPPKQFAISYQLIEEHFLSSPLARQQGAQPEAQPPFLLFYPLGNISGIYSTLPMLIRGQRVSLLERFSVRAWCDHVRRYRPSHSGLPPSYIRQLLDADIPAEDLASIRALGVGAAPLDPAVQQAFEDRYGIPVLLSYGATEFAGPVAMMTEALHAEWGRIKLGSVGRALPGAKLRVVDPETGVELGAGLEGRLDVVSPRYGNEWISTADIAMIDADGFLFLRGRADGAIIRGGFKILPESVERALATHPAVSEALVTGIFDPRLGQVPVAGVRLRPGAERPAADALAAHVRERVPATHIPVKWQFFDALPVTASHKPDRQALRQLFETD